MPRPFWTESASARAVPAHAPSCPIAVSRARSPHHVVHGRDQEVLRGQGLRLRDARRRRRGRLRA
eukprot:4283543-Alexandrium_andersonii.AAC.1